VIFTLERGAISTPRSRAVGNSDGIGHERYAAHATAIAPKIKEENFRTFYLLRGRPILLSLVLTDSTSVAHS